MAWQKIVAFLWLAADDPELSEKAKELFQDTENLVYLSVVSIWEIVVKYHLGKLPLPSEPEYFIEQQCEQHLIDTLSYAKAAGDKEAQPRARQNVVLEMGMRIRQKERCYSQKATFRSSVGCARNLVHTVQRSCKRSCSKIS